MWSQMTALVQEVKLQGRSFKQLSDAVAPVADLAPRLVEMEREAQTKARREVLEMFLDLRDRMVRGLETARKSLVRLEGLSPRGWRRKMLDWESLRETARETAVALEKRSEEHTSELQSLTNLVCRLLLEKKNQRVSPCDLGVYDSKSPRRDPRDLPLGKHNHRDILVVWRFRACMCVTSGRHETIK